MNPSSSSSPPTGPARKVRLLLVDTHDISRRSFRQLLEAIGTFEVVGDTGDTAEAMSLAEHQLPDVVLMGMRVRGSSGIEMTQRFRAMPHAPKVVMLTLYDSPAYMQETAREGDHRRISSGSMGTRFKSWRRRCNRYPPATNIMTGKMGSGALRVERPLKLQPPPPATSLTAVVPLSPTAVLAAIVTVAVLWVPNVAPVASLSVTVKLSAASVIASL